MKQIKYSRKINQFRNTARHVNELIETRHWQTMTEKSKHQFQWKLNNLFETVRNFLSKKELKKILAAAAFLICIGTVNAQSFAPAVDNPFGLTQISKYELPCFTDFDNDGDFDLLVSEYPAGFDYFENIGTISSPSFAAPQSNPFGLTPISGSYSHTAADLDNDGDPDILLGEYYGEMNYYQNVGTAMNPSYNLPVTNPFGLDSANQQAFPAFTDLDDDGDFDILVGEYYGAYKYFENIGTASAPSYSTPLQNPFGLIQTNTIAFPATADIDNDGDLDLLIGTYYGNMFLYQNTGTNISPSFSTPIYNPFGLTPTSGFAAPSFADIDNDGDDDLIVGDTTGILKYFENTTFNPGIAEIYFNPILNVFPDPASDQVTIRVNYSNNSTIRIKDATGKIVSERILDTNEAILNISDLQKGIYFIEFSDRNKFSVRKLVIE